MQIPGLKVMLQNLHIHTGPEPECDADGGTM